MKKCLSIVTAFCVTAALAAPAHAQTTDVVNGDIAYFQDFKEFEPRERGGEEFGGIARLAHVLEQLRAQEGDPTLVMGGELVGGSSFNAIHKGAPFVEAFNELGVDVGNFGNHDFDYGAEHALDMVELAEYDWISSNLVNPDGSPFSPDGTVSVQESGVRLGFVALTSDLDRTSAAREVLENDLIGSARAGVDKLQGENVDAIILLTQVSRVNTIAVMEAVPELDAALREENGASLPTEVHQTADGRYIVGPDADYGAVVHLDITADRATGETTIEPAVIRLDETVPEEPTWAARSEAYYQDLDDRLGGVIAHTEVALDRAELGIMVADSYRRHFDTQLGWQNGGGIRTELPAGDITLRDAYSVLPFGNKAVAVEATGEEILLGLEQGIASNPAGGNGFPRVAGLSFEFEADAAFGERVTSVTMEDGSALDPNATYTLAISQFLQEGGDGTDAFLDNTLLTTKMVTDVDAFVALLTGEDIEQPGAGGSSGSSAGPLTSLVAAIADLFGAVAGSVAQLFQQIFGR
ncbi:bifunctional metallophosphatase/5'-nucleotidase [Corynebacterium sp. A21]|uniref:bifunctional metallophosphatase/5'-nucleotidase n=1 Tax=Corynebacterium sp. A21 TaxID=3457318 RepID=UPI003FCFB526